MRIKLSDLNKKTFKILDRNKISLKNISLNIDPELYGKLKIESGEKNITANLLAINILEQYYGLEETIKVSKTLFKPKQDKPIRKYILP